MDNELPRQELVKCVVVGDSATGKTRLIVARATNQAMPRSQLFQTHIPSVWAIDQYRICQEVLENSWENVDGVSITLRLWDTFGDHEKDRRFAYGRADVVLLCFSIADSLSLKNVQKVWVPEIKHFCGRTPIILCGTKNDLRYADLEALIKERGPVSHHCTKHRPFDPKGVVPPHEGRNVAKEIGAIYYETSSYTLYGVQEVFDNVVRAALISRRQHRFWQSNLKKVQKPMLQAPFLPACPREPHVCIQESTYIDDIASLLSDVTYADVTFVIQGELIQAEKVVLMAASRVFHDLFVLDLYNQLRGENISGCMSHCGSCSSLQSHVQTLANQSENSLSAPNLQTEEEAEKDRSLDVDEHYLSISPNGNTCIITSKQVGTEDAVVNSSNSNNFDSRTCIGSVQFAQAGYENDREMDEMSIPVGIRCLPGRLLTHPAFYSIHLQQTEDVFSGRPVLRSVVVLNRKITPDAFKIVLQYLYSGSVPSNSRTNWGDLCTAANLLEIPDLETVAKNIRNGEEFLNVELSKAFLHRRTERLRELFVEKGILSDITIKLDDGPVSAHKCLLMVRCDPMLAMLGGHFRESAFSVVPMEGFCKAVFLLLLEYLYTDQCPSLLSYTDTIGLMKLANFLCLPRLVQICEKILVDAMKGEQDKLGNIDEHVISALKCIQSHNAHNLYHWLMHYLSIHFIDIEKNRPKLLHDISPDDLKMLQRKRWPPSYYLEEAEYYEKCLDELKKSVDRTRKHKWSLKK